MNMDFAVTSMNVWKEVRASLQHELSQGEVLLLINNAEFVDLLDVLNLIEAKRMLYVSMTKTAASVVAGLKKSKAQPLFIDCVSPSIFAKQAPMDCRYARMPQDFDHLYELMAGLVQEVLPHIVVVDSISQLIDFSVQQYDRSQLEQFVRQLKRCHRRYGARFILLYDDRVKRKLINLPGLYVDSI
ncbi:hypothetical protein COY28_06630, partial [Candidatus Woesearchaeota archaeon CG_4_10_14_0_2_um_filter_57_5]